MSNETNRSAEAMAIRELSKDRLKYDFERGYTKRETNYERGKYEVNGEVYFPWMFSKTLVHDEDTGFAKKDHILKVVKAQEKADKESLKDLENLVPSDKRAPLTGITADNSYNLMGMDSFLPTSNKFYTITSKKGLFEMAEVYVKSLVRDIAFCDFNEKNRNVEKYERWLNEFGEINITAPMELDISKNKKHINFKTFLRGNGKDELTGPYISQFLYLPFAYGNNVVHQKYFSEPDNVSSVTSQGWRQIQNGEISTEGAKSLLNQDQKSFKYCHTPRVLGSMVHRDPLYQFYYNAALVALQNDIKLQGFDNIINKDNFRSTEWTSSGNPDVFASIAHVALGALRVAWYHKYGVAMKIRPEVYAQRIQLAYEKDDQFVKNVEGLRTLKVKCDENYMQELLQEVSEKNNELLGKVNNNNRNYYLNLQYPEGSPTHPSHPAGHACVAGACCTVLKAMFQCHKKNFDQKLPWPRDAMHSIDGDELVNFGKNHKMTIVGEFNKLASNISLGRDFAGVHYRADGDYGMAIGEQYAISYLTDKCKEYYESKDKSGLFKGFFLEKFDGTKVVIKRSGEEPYSPPSLASNILNFFNSSSN